MPRHVSTAPVFIVEVAMLPYDMPVLPADSQCARLPATTETDAGYS